jgi:hypothetical protein
MFPYNSHINIAYVSAKDVAGEIGYVFYVNSNPVPGVTQSSTTWDGQGAGGQNVLEFSQGHNNTLNSTRAHYQDSTNFISHPTNSTVDTTSPPKVPVVVTNVHRASGTSRLISHWIDGGTVFESKAINSGQNGNTATTIVLGGHGSLGTPTRKLNGVICELIMWLGAPSDSTRYKVEGYLAHKWGQAASLPLSHPYKTTPYYCKYIYKTETDWIPSDSSKLIAWWDTADDKTVTEVAGAVSQLTDKSVNGWDAYQTFGTNQPLYGVDQINNKDVIKFDGSNDILYFKKSGQFISFIDRAVFAVVKPNVSKTQVVVGSSTSATLRIDTTTNFLHVVGGASNPWSTGGTSILAVPIGSPHIIGYEGYQYLITSLDGVSYTHPNLRNNQGFNLSTIGAGDTNNQAGGTAERFNGDIAEVIFMNAVSVPEKEIIEGYLAWKWGLVANLPLTHPYKNAPPKKDRLYRN